MPIPEPRDEESQKEFIKRCLKKLAKEDPDRSQDERAAICYKAYREKNSEQKQNT